MQVPSLVEQQLLLLERSKVQHSMQQVQFKLEPYTLDPAVSRSEFKFGDKTMEYRHGPIVPVASPPSQVAWASRWKSLATAAPPLCSRVAIG